MAVDRALLFKVALTGLVGAALFPFAIYIVGFAVAPPLPVPPQTPVPRVIADALWARAEGGRAAGLTPITPLRMGKFVACVAIEDFKDTTPGDARRITECRHLQPALLGVEYLSGVHMRDAGLQPSFRQGLARLSTTIWLTHAWTKDEFLNTLAERADFGNGWRGAEAASQAMFGRSAAGLTPPQAALLASRVGDTRANPWCETELATSMRNRVLERMRENGAIDEATFQAASTAALGLAPPPEGRPACND